MNQQVKTEDILKDISCLACLHQYRETLNDQRKVFNFGWVFSSFKNLALIMGGSQLNSSRGVQPTVSK